MPDDDRFSSKQLALKEQRSVVLDGTVCIYLCDWLHTTGRILL